MRDPRSEWIRKPSTAVMVAVVLVALAAGTTAMPLPRQTAEVAFDAVGGVAGESAQSTLDLDGLEGTATDVGGDGAAIGVGDSSATGGTTAAGPVAGGAGDPATVDRASSGATTGSGTGTTTSGQPGTSAKGATYFGVKDNSVLWGTAAQKNGCGGFNQGEVQRAYGIDSNPEKNYDISVEYWNKFPLVDFPLPPEIRKHVNGKNGYWGRKIKTVFRDSGGYACQDVGRANAVRMAQEDKVFGLITPTNDGPEVPMSLVMAQHKRIHIGRWMTGPHFWKPRAPYFFDGRWGDYVSQNLALGSWACRDWVGRKAHDTGDVRVTGLPRVFGITYADVPDFREAAAVLKGELARCGGKATEYAIPFEEATLAANSQTIVARMIRDGVTTILSVNDFLTRLLLSEAATNQNWHPEWVNSGQGIGSYPGAYNTFMTPDQAANAWAAADAASITDPPFHKTESYRAWKRVRPNEEPDDSWAHWYHQFKLLALGMAGAGRNLTPETFAEGLARLCNPCPRADRLQPLRRAGPGNWADLEGFTLVKWNPDKPCHVCTPDRNGNPPKGYFDFIENGKRYGLRITDPG